MFLPFATRPRATGRPVVTLSIIVFNVAVYLLILVPLSRQAADTGDPLYHDYQRAVRYALDETDLEYIPDDILGELTERPLTAGDLFTLRWSFRPARMRPATAFTGLFLHANL